VTTENTELEKQISAMKETQEELVAEVCDVGTFMMPFFCYIVNVRMQSNCLLLVGCSSAELMFLAVFFSRFIRR